VFVVVAADAAPDVAPEAVDPGVVVVVVVVVAGGGTLYCLLIPAIREAVNTDVLAK